jgi:hypothetical protein
VFGTGGGTCMMGRGVIVVEGSKARVGGRVNRGL